jgi:hypothetical protein
MKILAREAARRFDPWLACALLVVALALGRLVAGPLTGDDDYVLHNLSSPGWRDVLFAYNVDLVRGEGGETTWYEGFGTLQRRYVRVVPSALMATEYRLFGSDPLRLKSVSLLVHLLNLALAYRLLRRWRTDPATAAAFVALVGLHPAAAECILWFACQPILWAALGSLLAASALLRLREAATPWRRAAFVSAGAATLFSYEAAVGVPLLLVGLDWFWPRDGGARRPSDRWASAGLLAVYPAYVAVALWNRAGTTLTDASYRAPAGELLANVRADLANYLVKLLPLPPYGADAYAAIGSWTGAAIVAAVVGLWLHRIGPSSTRATGLWVFAVTLAPSLLTRAAVSVLNFPSFRQLYLPLAGVGVLLCAWRPLGLGRLGRWVAGLVVLALFVLYQGLAPARARSADRVAQRDAGARLEQILAGLDPGVPVVQVGESSCGYSLSYDTQGREVWKLVPPTTEGGVPGLRAIDDRTLEVRAPEGEALALGATPAADSSSRRTRAVPPLLTAGWQRLGLATAHAPERSGDAVSAFRLAFDRPLAAYAFVRVSGCVALERWRP